MDYFLICACHPYAWAMLIFYVSFQFYWMPSKRLIVYHSLPNHSRPTSLENCERYLAYYGVVRTNFSIKL